MKRLALIALLAGPVACSSAAPIQDDEEAVLFSACAIPNPSDGSWTIPVHGWIYKPKDDSSLRHQFLTRVIDSAIPLSDLTGESFDRRAALFLADNQSKRRIKVRLGGKAILLPDSEKNGHFMGEIQLSREELATLPNLRSRPGVKSVPIETAPASDGRTIQNRAFFPQPQGLSVISDIDDTIKLTDVLQRRELIFNTFLREFRAIDGMAQLYSRWEGKGAFFHYVSSCPWQLYPELDSFMTGAGFPRGSIHLKALRVWDSSFFDLFKPGTETKPAVIGPILEAFPDRTFLLVGDSGEQDPEIYGELLRQHPPERIRHAYIRNVTGQSLDDSRWQTAFREVDPSRWTLFTDPGEIQ